MFIMFPESALKNVKTMKRRCSALITSGTSTHEPINPLTPCDANCFPGSFSDFFSFRFREFDEHLMKHIKQHLECKASYHSFWYPNLTISFLAFSDVERGLNVTQTVDFQAMASQEFTYGRITDSKIGFF